MHLNTLIDSLAAHLPPVMRWAGSVAMEIQRAGDSTVAATFNDGRVWAKSYDGAKWTPGQLESGPVHGG
jgi:hypothetical protein